MIARVMALFSPGVFVPKGEEFSIYEVEVEGYKVKLYPPQGSGLPDNEQPGGALSINDVPTLLADVVWVDFIKDNLERREGHPPEPSDELVGNVVNDFLLRLRHVTRSGYIRPLKFPLTQWKLTYLKDDGSPLEKETGVSGGRGHGMNSFSWVAFTKDMWHTMMRIKEDPPPWDELLLDASVELPNIGPAIVLAAITLEVFISNVLDKLAIHKGISPSMWSWLNNRGDYDKNPHVEEQFDVLLKELTGHSLKEEQELWKLFMDVKSARNKFVHEGKPKLGKKVVNEDTARVLVDGANRIIAKVREWTPQELQWPEYRHNMKLAISQTVG